MHVSPKYAKICIFVPNMQNILKIVKSMPKYLETQNNPWTFLTSEFLSMPETDMHWHIIIIGCPGNK